MDQLELLYTQTASIESAKLHQSASATQSLAIHSLREVPLTHTVSVDFLRRSLKSRPLERAGKSRGSATSGTTGSRTQPEGDKSSPSTSSNKRKEGADQNQSQDDIDIYDEACSEIRHALDAYAVAVVDLSQFHLFYPTFAGSSTGGSSRMTSVDGSRSSPTEVPHSRGPLNSSGAGQSTEYPYSSTQGSQAEDEEGYSRSRGSKRARQTWALTDPTAPSRTPQVLYIPAGKRAGSKKANPADEEVRI